MTNKQSDEFVIKKWEILCKVDYRKYKGKTISDIFESVLPLEIVNFIGSCAWCEKWGKRDDCNKKCPLMQTNNHCDLVKSIYEKWIYHPTRQNARAMLALCKRAIKVARNKEVK